MFCSECGKKIPDSAKFCIECGAPVIIPKEEPEAPKRTSRRTSTRVKEDAAPAEKKTTPEKPAADKKTAAAKKPATPKKPAADKKTATEKKQAAPKKSSSKRFVAFAMAVVLLFTAFVQPGFLRKKKGGNGGVPKPTVGQTTGTQGNGTSLPEEPEELVITKDNAPSAPANIDIRLDLDEIEAIEPERHEFTEDEPYFLSDDVIVNMKSWNLENKNDVLDVRRVGKKTTSDGEQTLTIYSFELESGQKEFGTSVEVTLPRPQNGNANGVVYYNPETEEWEPTVYSISDDGLYYTWKTRHFSVPAVVEDNTKSAAILKVPDHILQAEEVDPRNGKYKGVFYLGLSEEEYKNLSGYKICQYPLRIDDEMLHNMFREPFFEDKAAMEAFDEKATEARTAIPDTFAMLCNYQGGLDFGMNADTLLEEGVSSTAPVGTTLFDKMFFGVSAIMVTAKICYQLYHGSPVWKTIYDNYDDMSGVAVGAMGIAGMIGAGPCAAVAAVLYLKPIIREKVSDYWNYEKGLPYQNRAYYYYMDHEFMVKGEKGPGVILKMDGTNWASAFRRIYTDSQGNYKQAANEILNLYDRYVDKFWDDLDEDYRESYYGKYTPESKIDYLGQMVSVPWEEPRPEQIEEMKKYAKQRIMDKTEAILASVASDYIDELELKFKTEVHMNIASKFNSILLFEVEDPDLKEGQFFNESNYFRDNKDGKAMWFDDCRLTLLPRDMSVNDYPKSVFYPVANTGNKENSNRIYACRFFNYYQMGEPTCVRFASNPEKNAPPAHADIVRPTNPVNTNKIKLKIVKDKEEFKFQEMKFDAETYQTEEPAHFSVEKTGELTVTIPAINNEWTKISGFTVKGNISDPDFRITRDGGLWFDFPNTMLETEKVYIRNKEWNHSENEYYDVEYEVKLNNANLFGEIAEEYLRLTVVIYGEKYSTANPANNSASDKNFNQKYRIKIPKEHPFVKMMKEYADYKCE